MSDGENNGGGAGPKGRGGWLSSWAFWRKGPHDAPDAALLRDVVHRGRDGVLTFGLDYRVEFANPAALELFGETAVREGADLREILGPDRSALDRRELRALEDNDAHSEAWGRREDGQLFPVDLMIATLQHGRIRRRVAFVRDLSQQKSWMRRIEYQATHDLLTNLPNRARITELARRELQHAEPTSRAVGFVVLDLARFREINDSLGYSCGDDVLRRVARRLEVIVGERGTVARLGADQFAVLVPNGTVEALERLADAIADEMQRPVELEQIAVQVVPVIGVASAPRHARGAGELMQCAESARNRAKHERRWFAEYEPTPRHKGLRSLTLLAELQKALRAPESGGLYLAYQPQVLARDESVVGVETLVRWRHPELGDIAPSEFIELAENSGLIRPLTRWVLSASLDQVVRWRRYGIEVGVAVNLSSRVLVDRSLVGFVRELLRSTSIPPRSLTLEVTESVLLEDPIAALEVMAALESYGSRLSIDDFGTGYSSLSYLSRMPASELKIDRSFVAAMHRDDNQKAIVEATIGLARHLNLSVVAEGVETDAQWSALREMNVHVGQGYLFSPALEPDKFVQWLGQERWRAEQQDKDDSIDRTETPIARRAVKPA